MENLIRETNTQQQATQISKNIAETILPTQVTSGIIMIFILFAAVIAAWWVNQTET